MVNRVEGISNFIPDDDIFKDDADFKVPPLLSELETKRLADSPEKVPSAGDGVIKPSEATVQENPKDEPKAGIEPAV